jgi:hypothetical protein
VAAPSSVSLGSRLASVVGTPRRWLAAALFLIIAAVIVFVIGFSGAVLTSTSKTPQNSFNASEIKFSLSDTGQLINGSDLKPGVVRSGSVTVRNGGERGKFTLGTSGLNDGGTASLGPILDVVVEQTAPTSSQVFSGKLDKLQNAALGTFSANENRTHKVTLTWPSSETCREVGRRGRRRDQAEGRLPRVRRRRRVGARDWNASGQITDPAGNVINGFNVPESGFVDVDF